MKKAGDSLLLGVALALFFPIGAFAETELLQEGPSGVTIRFVLPALVTEEAPEGKVILQAGGLALSAEEGAPAVPEERVLLALPPGASAVVELEPMSIERTDEYRVAPIPYMDREEEAHYRMNETLAGRLYPEVWVEASAPARLRDQRVATITIHPVRHDFGSGATEILRSAIVRVRFVGGARPALGENPPAPDAFELVYERAIRNVRSAVEWRARSARPSKILQADSFASSPNWYKLAVSSRGLHAVTYDDLAAAGLVDPGSAIGDPRTLRVYAGGGLTLPEVETAPRLGWMRQVAILVTGEEDGSFDPGDRIEFYALRAAGWRGEYDPTATEYYDHFAHTFTYTNVYWLTWGGSFEEPVARIASIDASPAGEGAVTIATFPDRVHAEQDTIQDLSRPGEDGWFWDKFSPSENDKSFFVRIFDADSSADGNVRVRFYHYADNLAPCGTERARIQVNGVPSTLQEWNSCAQVDRAIQPFDYDSTAHWVKDGFNRFDIQVAFRQKVYLCWIEMGYRRFFRARDGELHFRLEEPGEFRVPIAGFPASGTRVFEVTDPFDVKELAGLSSSGDSLLLRTAVSAPRTFHALAETAWHTPDAIEKVVPANLRDEANAAEYLIVCYDPFVSALSELVAHRSTRHTTRVVRLSDVYNEFSWGLTDGVAIRDFLMYAYHNWPAERRPVFVLLVGDATSDWKGRQSTALTTLLPTFFRVDPGGSDTNTYATDDFYSYLDPNEGIGDRAPDIAVGRFPVNSIEEARTVIAKTVQYETDPELGPWRNRVLFLADDEVKKDNMDCAFLLSHTSDAEAVSTRVPMSFDREKVYMVEYPLTSSGLKPLAKEAYISLMSEGYLYSNYQGHGGFDKMADEELFLLSEATPEIVKNGRRLHIMGAYSCSIGSFDLPERNSLAETLLKMADGGAIASFSSDAPAFAGVSRDLDIEFVSHLFPSGHRPAFLGLAAAAAKSVAGLPSPRKTNDEKYTILGDPALRLGVPRHDVRFQSGQPIRFERGRVDTLVGEVFDTTGTFLSTFEGSAYLNVKGMADTLGYSFLDSSCYGEPNNPRAYKTIYQLDGPTFFRGEVDVRGGRFSAPFFVPRDTRVGTIGRVSAYVVDPGARIDGSGGTDSVDVKAEPSGTVWNDHAGPEVVFTVNGVPVRDGTSFTKASVFEISLEDESGINLQRNDNFYTIHLVFDRGRPIDLTPLFEYQKNSFRKGGLSFRLSDFSEVFLQGGSHELSLRAADNLDNRTERDYQILVVEAGEKLAFRSPVLNYPNPFDPEVDGETEIAVELTRSARVTVQIFTLTGKRIREVDVPTAETGLSARFEWDGTDQDGDPVANGVYLVRAVAETEDGSERTEAVGKAVVLRGVR